MGCDQNRTYLLPFRFVLCGFAAALMFMPIEVRAGMFDRAVGGFSDAVSNIANLRPGDVTSLKLGVGAGWSPSFEGSRDTKWRPIPLVSLKYRDVLKVNNNDIDFTAFDQIFDMGDALGQGRLEMGPSVNFDFGRGEGDSRDLRGMGNVGFSLELGGYVAYVMDRARIELDFGHDVAGGHGGGLADLKMSTTLYRDDRMAVGAHATLTLATSKYLKSFFGVTTAQAGRTGLPIFRPSGGLKNAFVGLSGSYELSRYWSVLVMAGYERLLGDAEASPFIKRRGDPNQASTSVFVAYTF